MLFDGEVSIMKLVVHSRPSSLALCVGQQINITWGGTMSEYGISSRTKKYSCFAISLVPIIVFCGFMALMLALIFLFRAYNNYSAISNGIAINPSVPNAQMLSREKQQLLLAISNFIILLICVF
jgi:hypothetical protein